MLDNIFKNKEIPLANKLELVLELQDNPGLTNIMIEQIITRKKLVVPAIDEQGYYGNVWVRKLHFPTVGTFHKGHSHNHDHMSLLVKGSVKVKVEGYVTKTYTAPTFIIIKENEKHDIVALEDDTLWFCVFSLFDEDKLDLDNYYSKDNDPMSDKMEVDLK